MICRNCNYILTGNEQFCPHCATPVTKKDIDKDSSSAPPPIFSPDKQRSNDEIKQPANRIFLSPEQDDTEPEVASGKKRAVILSLSLLLVLLCAFAFFLAEKLDIAPALSSLISPVSQADTTQSEGEETVSTTESELDEGYGVLPADISYKPSNCFVSSDISLPLRKGPDDTYAQVTILKVGQQLQIIGGSLLTDKWLYIYYPEEDLYGWTKAAFLTSAKPLEQSSEATSQEDEITSEAQQQEVSQ